MPILGYAGSRKVENPEKLGYGWYMIVLESFVTMNRICDGCLKRMLRKA